MEEQLPFMTLQTIHCDPPHGRIQDFLAFQNRFHSINNHIFELGTRYFSTIPQFGMHVQEYYMLRTKIHKALPFTRS